MAFLGLASLLFGNCRHIVPIEPPAHYPPGIDTAAYSQIPQSDIYEVSVIRDGVTREKQLVFESKCPTYQLGYMNMTTNDQYPAKIFKGRTISWTTFSFTGSVIVEVKLLSQPHLAMSSDVKILPSRKNIHPLVSGNTIAFRLDNPGQFSVEIGDSGYRNGLMVFANPAETNKPDTTSGTYKVLRNATASDANAAAPYTGIYFKAGVHDIGVFNIPSNIKNVYLEEGAWVYGTLIMNGNPGVHIFGRGVLSSARLNYRQSHCVEAITQSNNINLEGITIADTKYFAVRLIGKNNTVSWVKVIGGWTYNCDGIAVYDNSTVSNCFVWANDDNIKVYRPNIQVSDCVLWQLNNGGAIQLSWGNANASNVTISRTDILHGEWNNDAVNRGVISCVGDKFAAGNMSGSQQNFLIDDLVTETPVPLIFRISPNPASPELIHGMVFKDWNVKQDTTSGFPNYIQGGDPAHPFDGFVFDHFIYNGTQVTADNWLGLMKLDTANLVTPVFQ